MTNINPLLDVMSEIDDNLIVTDTKKTRKRPLLIAVAAAAALTVITGAAGAAVINKFQFTVNDEPFMDLNMKVQKDINLDPYEQLIEMGARHDRNPEGTDFYLLTARPSEVFEVLNAPLLLNDNFTDEPTQIQLWLSNVADDTERGFLFVHYDLYDKETGVKVEISSECILSENAGFSSGYNREDEKKPEILDLNDGSKLAFFYDNFGDVFDEHSCWSGDFSYGGIFYRFHIDKPMEVDPTGGYSLAPLGYDAFIETLDRLGIL